jgi:hypothetical protein
VLTRKDYMGAHEWCFYGWREGAAHQFYGPNNATDLLKRTSGLLTAGSLEAVKTLLDLQKPPTPPSVRLGAATARGPGAQECLADLRT